MHANFGRFSLPYYCGVHTGACISISIIIWRRGKQKKYLLKKQRRIFNSNGFILKKQGRIFNSNGLIREVEGTLLTHLCVQVYRHLATQCREATYTRSFLATLDAVFLFKWNLFWDFWSPFCVFLSF